ncbi:hypothetical protein VTG60DRAFT_4001 [Thermothelomyces hinnuleus]
MYRVPNRCPVSTRFLGSASALGKRSLRLGNAKNRKARASIRPSQYAPRSFVWSSALYFGDWPRCLGQTPPFPSVVYPAPSRSPLGGLGFSGLRYRQQGCPCCALAPWPPAYAPSSILRQRQARFASRKCLNYPPALLSPEDCSSFASASKIRHG